MLDDKDISDKELFTTEFPKKGYSIIDYLQGRVHFSILDQIKFMQFSGMMPEDIKKTIKSSVDEIINNYDFQKND